MAATAAASSTYADVTDLAPLPLVRTDPGQAPQHPSLLWLGRPPDSGKHDGVVVIPYELGTPCETQPLCWFFGLDVSGSMHTPVEGTRQPPLTRWNITLQLLQRVVADLVAAQRTDDTLTLVTFNHQCQVVCDNQTLAEVQTHGVLATLAALQPTGRTNLQDINTTLHHRMLNNPHLQARTHRAVEILFTDGEPTSGLRDERLLQQDKLRLYQHLQRQHGGTDPPFLWCGAISTDANWRIVRGLSHASSLSLWAYIQSHEMQNFPGEVGGVVATVTCMRTYRLPPLTATGAVRTVLLLPDTTNAYYCAAEPPPHTAATPSRHALAPSLITLFKVRALLTQHDAGHLTLQRSDAQDCLHRVLARHKTDDPWISQSCPWSQYFDQLKNAVKDDLLDLLRTEDRHGRLELHRQSSTTRDLYTACHHVQLLSSDYQHLP